MIPTRQILWNINVVGPILLYIVMVAPFALLAFGIARRVRMWRLGLPDDRFDHLPARLWNAFLMSILHGRIVRKRALRRGLMHAAIFAGFIALFIGTIIVMIQSDIATPLFGFRFYQGAFYLGYKLALNLAGVILIAGILYAIYRRVILQPKTLQTAADDVIILAFLLVLVIQGFVLQALRLAVTHDSWAVWSFVSYPLSLAFDGLSSGWLRAIHETNWYAHWITTYAFEIYFVYSKMIHPFTSFIGVTFRRTEPRGALEPIANLEEAETFGVSKLEDFTWAQLMSLDACMHCGRCLEFCPTFNTGKPLRPRDLVLQLDGFMADKGGIFSGELGQGQNDARFRWGSGPNRALIPEVVTPAELWDCTTCGACMEQCPVYIEHVPLIVGMRRSQVLEESEFPPELTSVFNNLERNGNPWQFPRNQRDDWTKKVKQPIPRMAEVAAKADDGQGGVEVLFFVGCLGSFDSRNQRTTIALAQILQEAGINFAILGKEECCNGDPAKRTGNEYLAQMLAQQTVETLNAYSFKKIVTACPHCFNAIKNEYPQIGGNYEVVHHSQLINQLISEGRIKLDPNSAMARGKVTYHDPCYLGRYNSVYDDPRAVIGALPGAELTEMRRNRNKSFCCGGGGGRMFMEETRGTRINQMRVREAMDTGAEMLCAACPFCMTMFEDGIHGVGAEEKFKVLDIAEIVVESMTKPD